MSHKKSEEKQHKNSSNLITKELSEVEALGFNAKYFKSTQKEYKVSRGKTRIFRRSISLILLGMVISILSLKLLPDHLEGVWYWLSPMLWFPRLAAFFFIYLAVMKLREMKKIVEILSFSKEGIKVEESIHSWESIEKVQFQYDEFEDDIYDLLIYTKNGIIKVDISNVDEFSEDVAAVLDKYMNKYKS